MGPEEDGATPRRQWTRRGVLLTGGALVGSALVGSHVLSTRQRPIVVTYGDELRVSRLQIGYVDTDRALIPDDGQVPEVLAERQRTFVSSSLTHGNIHIMGWGLDTPWRLHDEPIDLTALNAKIDAVAAAGVEPIVTFCTAPWWMRCMQITGEPLVATTAADGTYLLPDWEHLDTSRVAGDRMDAWLHLVARVAEASMRRGVRTFLVWNELKGFWMNTGEFAPGKWNMSGQGANPSYKEFFRETRRAVLGARPAGLAGEEVKVGGPYLNVAIRPSSAPGAAAYGEFDPISLQALDEWFDDPPDHDLLAFGQWNVRPGPGGIEWAPPDPYAAGAVFADLLDLLRSTYGVSDETPIVMAEWYALRGDLASIDPPSREAADASSKACAAIRFAEAGGQVLLNWSGHGDGTPSPGLWERVVEADGSASASPSAGQPTAWGRAVSAFNAHFGPGEVLLRTAASSPAIEVLATASKTMVVNTTAMPQRVSLGGRIPVGLGPYEVGVIDTPAT